jgi:D-aspartate ligase
MTLTADWRGRMRSDVPAVVMKLTADRLQHGSLAVARSLGRLGVPVYFTTVDARAPALRSRYSRGQPIRLDPAGDRTLEPLLQLAAHIGDRPILIPADDVAALFVDDHRAAIAEAFRLPAQPAGLPEALSDKGALHRLCEANGIPTPKARFPQTRDEFLGDAAELGYPVVIKSMNPRLVRRRPRAVSVAVVQNAAEAAAVHDRGEDPTERNLMLQEFIPGGASSIWMFNGYFDTTGACAFGAVGQKIRQAPPRTGATSLGVVAPNDEVSSLAITFLGKLGYRGIVDLGFRFDARDGRYKLLDVNPRIGSTFRLFVGRNGLDVVRALYLDLTGQPVPRDRAQAGRRWLVEDQDVSTALRLAGGRELGPREYLRSLRGIEETAWLSRDDPLPVVDMLAVTAVRVLRGGVRRIRSARLRSVAESPRDV